MNLHHRAHPFLVLGFILGLALLGREVLRPDDAAHAPASSDDVAIVADSSDPAASPTVAQPAAAADVTPAPNIPSASGTFRGRVIDAATRQPVREFELEFHPMRQLGPGEQAPGARTFRTKDGRFEWQGIPSRPWMVTLKARGYQRFDLEQLLIAAGTATDTVMPLQRGHTLRGRVFDETSGAGIASASIDVREAHVGRYDDNFRMRVKTTTGKDGSFVIDGVPAGSLILSVNAPKYTPREIDAVVGKQISPLQIGLTTGGGVTVYLVAADGVTPVAGSASVLHLDEGHSFSGRTSDAGEISFDHLPTGRYRLGARSGNLSAKLEFWLAKDERKEGIVLALSGGSSSVRGVITGVRPADLERVHVAAYGESSSRGREGTRVNARGEYELHNVEPGKVTVSASIEGDRQITKTLQVPPDADVIANLEFPPGARLTGNVTRGGKPVANVLLQPQPLQEQKLFIGGAQTSERGEYVIEDVPNGTYSIRVGTYISRNFEVSGDTVFDIDVPVAQLAGRAVEEGGKVPVVGVTVRLWPAQRQSRLPYWQERSNHLGEFAIVGLEPGDYLLSAYKPGYEMYRERISYGPASDGMTIQLRQGKGVAIRLFEAGTARPVRNAHVSESIGGHPGLGLQLHLDENGVGYIPSALTGSTLTFHVSSYAPAVISDWNGQELDVQLERRAAQ